MTKTPLIVLVGSTAVGKTSLSIQLAEIIGGEIISADSRLFYRGMDTGTAKPSSEEMGSTVHHMIDMISPDEPYSLGEYLITVRKLIPEIWSRGKMPILVGGTGQYIRAVTEGWIVPEQEPDPVFRKYFSKLKDEIGYETLHQILTKLDPEAADTIDPPNVRRTIRALEVIFRTGEKFSTQKRRKTPPYQIIQIGLQRPRPELYDRIDRRVDLMIENGLLEEIRNLIKQGYSPDLPSFSAIGYQQICNYLAGAHDLAEAIRLIKSKTRKFVRRQANWFKLDDPEIYWVHPEETSANQLAAYITQILKK